MALPVPTFKDFLDTFNSAKDECDLFGFVLFDERQSHNAIKEYCITQFAWFDGLARANSMLLFIPITFNQANGYQNCSLTIASQFRIPPNALPSFLFFTLEAGDICVRHAAYLPFSAKAFAATDQQEAETIISDLFSAVSEARAEVGNNEMIIKLKRRIDQLKVEQRSRPLKKWTKNYVLRLADLPFDFLQSMAKAFGERIAQA
ncbi:MAG: hypothetical protein U1E45_07195 [Geminicoccaceae bacterium]